MAVVAVAALSSFATMHWARSPALTDETDAHAWLHQKLNLIEDQHDQLESIEAKFAPNNRL